MKTKKKHTLFCLLILSCVFNSFSINAQETELGKRWKEVNLAEQIPEAALSTMPTEELIKAYLNSRYSGYLFLYNDI